VLFPHSRGGTELCVILEVTKFLTEDRSELYVSGNVSFRMDDPGRQVGLFVIQIHQVG